MLFGAQGGVIYNIESGHETPFGIEDNVYVLDLWLPGVLDDRDESLVRRGVAFEES